MATLFPIQYIVIDLQIMHGYGDGKMTDYVADGRKDEWTVDNIQVYIDDYMGVYIDDYIGMYKLNCKRWTSQTYFQGFPKCISMFYIFLKWQHCLTSQINLYISFWNLPLFI